MASRIDCAALVGDRYGAASLVQWAQFHLGPGRGVAQVDLRKRGTVEGLVRDEGVPGRPDAQGSGDVAPHRGLPGSELDQLATGHHLDGRSARRPEVEVALQVTSHHRGRGE
ncbi:hypothetical protein [Streptomyces sp. NPDC058206]|uniref:hypothetical protein n=1 Tax=Streptomyces sp. NPDC058206 TaxID=3346382 RepID=UPI0036EFAE6A